MNLTEGLTVAKNLWTVVCLFSFSCAAATAQNQMPREDVVDVPAVGDGLCVSNVFQTNMVLQRDKPVPIWGWAAAGEKVTVSFAEITVDTTAAADRRWQVTLPSMPASTEPRKLTVIGGEASLTLENILVGDVWVLGGQSNMEFPLSRVENGELEIVSANFSNIRILTVPAADGPDEKSGFERLHEWSSWFSRHFRKGDWDVCRPEIAQELSAIGYVFARRIHMTSQVPIGVIDASRGGTTVETWTPDAVLRGLETPEVTTLLAEWDQKVDEWDPKADLAKRVENFQRKKERFAKEGRQLGANETEPTDLRPGPAMDQNRPGNCYASMIAPLRGMAIKGAVFHQGYNNCFNGSTGAVMYRQVFPQMIAAWREAFGDPALPFGILSLCTEGQKQTLENYSEMMANPGPYIREAQYQTFLEMYRGGDANIGFASCYDLRRRWYHPQLKLPAGERLARWALATQYGVGNLKWKPPILQSMEVVKGSLVLTLDEAADAVDDGGPIVGFAIAGEDRQFHPATATHFETGKDDRGRAKTDKRRLVLSSPLVPEPAHFRYAWARSPLGNLQVSRNTDVPFATQRSDDWPLEATPLLFGDETPVKLDGRQKAAQRKALQKLDRERRIKLMMPVLEQEGVSVTTTTGEWGTVRGSILLQGKVPEADWPLQHPSLQVDSRTGGLANVFVYLFRRPDKVHPRERLKPGEETVYVDIRDGQLVPHAQTLHVGQTVAITNSDSVKRNVRLYPLRNQSIGASIAPRTPKGEGVPWTPEARESLPFQVKSDLDPQMMGYWLVADHPYLAATNERGEFTIRDLPVGEHELRIWHESVGYLDRKFRVNVRPGVNVTPPRRYDVSQFLNRG